MPLDPLSLATLVQAIAPGHHRQGDGIHGLTHWARVLENGTRVAEATAGADGHVVRLFAVFHDARRINDHRDPGHGARGGALARGMRAEWLDLSNEQMDLLEYACAHHTDGLTEAARVAETIAWADQRARTGHVPDFVSHWAG